VSPGWTRPIKDQPWRAVDAPHLVAVVRVGASVVNGTLVERAEEHAA
jgi:hypothetical protein